VVSRWTADVFIAAWPSRFSHVLKRAHAPGHIHTNICICAAVCCVSVSV